MADKTRSRSVVNTKILQERKIPLACGRGWTKYVSSLNIYRCIIIKNEKRRKKEHMQQISLKRIRLETVC